VMKVRMNVKEIRRKTRSLSCFLRTILIIQSQV